MPVKTNVKVQTYFKRFNKSSESNAEVHCFLFSFTDLIKSFEYLPNQIAYFNPLKNRDTISHFKNVSRYILRSCWI